MRDVSHTKGPWEINRGVSGQFNFYVCNPKGEAELGNWLVARTVWEVDAKLIAAAPEMLEALKLAMEALAEATAILGGEYGDHYATLCDKMITLEESGRDAIAKATQG